jgi:hypothetical protein
VLKVLKVLKEFLELGLKVILELREIVVVMDQQVFKEVLVLSELKELQVEDQQVHKELLELKELKELLVRLEIQVLQDHQIEGLKRILNQLPTQ